MPGKRPHPLLRLALFGALYFCGAGAVQAGAVVASLALSALFPGGPEALLGDLSAGRLPAGLLAADAWLALALAVGGAALFYAWGGDDPWAGLRTGWRELGRDTLIGLGLGLGSMLVVAAVYAAFGWSAWPGGAGAVGAALGALAVTGAALAPAAATEEVVFRGYILRTLEGWRGWPLALAASSALFGLAHALNPNVTPLALANVALAGAAFALAFRLTRTLWLPSAYHFMWNFAQGPLLGFPVSGLDFTSAVRAAVAGPPLFTGGAFGPEGGLVVTGLLFVSCGGLWLWGRAGADR
jgi:membrane protease YdiL (CAAX protease family)